MSVANPSIPVSATPAIAVPAPAPATLPVDDLFRLSVDQYHEMIRLGILTEDDAVELLEGVLVKKMPTNPLHRAVAYRIRKWLENYAVDGWFVDTNVPITIATQNSEPEPDIYLVRGCSEDYLARHPSPQDAALIVEVSQTTLYRDRGLKKQIYARAGVPLFWIVNLRSKEIEVYSSPTTTANPPDYAPPAIYGMQDQVPVILDGKQVGQLAVSQIIPG